MPLVPTDENEQIVTTLHDRYGQPVLVMSSRRYTVIDANGDPVTRSYNESIALVDGPLWNPWMMTHAKNPMRVAVCELCRRPPATLFPLQRPSHGLVSLAGAHHCASCGETVCPRHARTFGPEVRCIRCARLHRVKRLLRALLFREVE